MYTASCSRHGYCGAPGLDRKGPHNNALSCTPREACRLVGPLAEPFHDI